MNELLKKITVSTYLYALLIFLGYINYYTYYIHFDIQILDFLTFGELLLSFLNLTIPLLILVAIALFFQITAKITLSTESEETTRRRIEYSYDDTFEVYKGSLKNLKALLRENKWNSFSTYFYLLLFVYQFLFSVLVYAFLFLYPFELFFQIFGQGLLSHQGILLTFIAGIFWLLKFSEVLERVYENMELRRTIFYSSLVLAFIGFLTVINRLRAKAVKEEASSAKIEFSYKNETFKTGSNLIFIGQTQNYLFISNTKESSTIIFQKNKIDKLKIFEK